MHGLTLTTITAVETCTISHNLSQSLEHEKYVKYVIEHAQRVCQGQLLYRV